MFTTGDFFIVCFDGFVSLFFKRIARLKVLA